MTRGGKDGVTRGGKAREPTLRGAARAVGGPAGMSGMARGSSTGNGGGIHGGSHALMNTCSILYSIY